jgi:hypothetical protein
MPINEQGGARRLSQDGQKSTGSGSATLHFLFSRCVIKNNHYLVVNFFSPASCCCSCWSSAPLTVLLPEVDKAEVETRLRKIRKWSSSGRGQEVKTEDEGADEGLSVESENEEKKSDLSMQVKKKQRLRSPVWKYFKKCPKVKSIFVYSEGTISVLCLSPRFLALLYSLEGCAFFSIVPDDDPRFFFSAKIGAI